MIDIKYENGEIRINTGNLNSIFSSDQLPLRFNIVKTISRKVIWSTDLDSNMWATFPENEMNDVSVTTKRGDHLYDFKWNVQSHGSIFYKSLILYCANSFNNGKLPKGLVIGTHDGDFGEWIPVVMEQLSDVILVEGSRPQFDELCKNYRPYPNTQRLFSIITPDGEDVTFFEGGRGYTNSVVERVIRSWEIEEIHSTKRTTTSLNQLINENYPNGLDWLHLDVEGLDAKLIMSLEEKNIPPFMIFEDNNLLPEERMNVGLWLAKRDFSLYTENGISMATKKF